MPKIRKKKHKRRQKRRDEIPFSQVNRGPLPRPVPDMGSKKDYNRKKKHPKNWGDSD
jgi:hypothetical protein